MLLQLKDINKTYKTKIGENLVLDKLNLSVKKGEVLAIMGKSGCGKSTLLNIIGGITQPTKGDFIFEAEKLNMCNKKEMNNFRKQHLSFIIQDFALIKEKTVFQNVELPLLVRKIPRKERKIKVMEYLHKLGMEEKVFMYPNQLSGGEQQRVAIARALISNPDILLADEPTGSLDDENTTIILDILHAIALEGMTIIIVTHDIEVAKRCDRCVKIIQGKISEESLEEKGAV